MGALHLLPIDLKQRIFSLLPCSSVLVCKCVCTDFHKYLSSDDFIDSHRQKTKRVTFLARSSDSSLYSATDFVDAWSPTIILESNCKALFGSAEGLIMVSKLVDYEEVWVVRNPTTRHEVEITYPPSTIDDYNYTLDSGFGFDSNSKTFKVLTLSNAYKRGCNIPSTTVHVCDLTTGKWRIHLDYPFTQGTFSAGNVMPHLHNCLHWISYTSNECPDNMFMFAFATKRQNSICAFDLANETFRTIQMPELSVERGGEVGIFDGLAIINGRLATISNRSHGSLDVWIMENYGMVESWRRIHIQGTTLGRFVPLRVIDGHVMCVSLHEMRSWAIYKIDNNTWNMDGMHGGGNPIGRLKNVVAFEETLVSPPKIVEQPHLDDTQILEEQHLGDMQNNDEQQLDDTQNIEEESVGDIPNTEQQILEGDMQNNDEQQLDDTQNIEEESVGDIPNTEEQHSDDMQENVHGDAYHPEEEKESENDSAVAEEKKWRGWPGENVFRDLVPVQKVGGITGRKGEFINKMREETEARIKILDGPPGITERAILISAKEEPNLLITPAMDGLLQIHKRIVELDCDPANAALGATICKRLLVAASHSGSLIGKQGATVKSIQDDSHCIVRVLGGDDSVVEVQGDPANTQKGVATHLRKFPVDRSVINVFEVQMQAPNARGSQGMPPPQSWRHQPPSFPMISPGTAGHGYDPFMPPPQQRPYDNFYPPVDMSFEKAPRSGPPAYDRPHGVCAPPPADYGSMYGWAGNWGY